MTDTDKAVQEPSAEGTTVRRGRGRPKCFNEEEALHKAMLLFWAYGYEATTISDLTQALNITAPSLYGSFGDKSQLFYRCLDYYLATEACPIERIFQQARTAKIAIELYLHENIKTLVQEHKPSGCMLVVATMNCSEQNHQIQEQLLHKRHKVKQQIQQRLEQGIQDGDLAEGSPVADMTDFYTTVIQGLTIQARDGAGMEQLDRVAAHAMKSWALFS